jgi:hypothetical protein
MEEDVVDVLKRISDVIDSSCHELFSAYSVPLTQLDAADIARSRLEYCGVIGFTGDDMRGALLLGSSREPLVAVGSTDDAIRDWLAELTNQLLGRVKNQLVLLGPVIHVSTPIVLRGDYLSPMSAHDLEPHLFTTPQGGLVSVWLDAEIKPGLVLSETPDMSATTLEGEALLF